ncbi:hypothetical protein EV426DRAFT_700450 [Tirmania nivea]|nr:hypothetical protein EV426DRAFT_700450 [Tirmania nivea]
MPPKRKILKNAISIYFQTRPRRGLKLLHILRHILPSYLQITALHSSAKPLAAFNAFFTAEVWKTLGKNTNAYYRNYVFKLVWRHHQKSAPEARNRHTDENEAIPPFPPGTKNAQAAHTAHGFPGKVICGGQLDDHGNDEANGECNRGSDEVSKELGRAEVDKNDAVMVRSRNLERSCGEQPQRSSRARRERSGAIVEAQRLKCSQGIQQKCGVVCGRGKQRNSHGGAEVGV